MLEPLFRCNLECAGCGKIDYPDEVLNRRLSVKECLSASDECGAPIVAISGGEPLIHEEMPQIVSSLIRRKKFVYLCTNGLLLNTRINDYTPSPYLTLSIHLDGYRERHDALAGRQGVFDSAAEAIKLACGKGFRVTINCTLYEGIAAQEVSDFFDFIMSLGVEGIMVSPAYRYAQAPQKDIFLMKTRSIKPLSRSPQTRQRSKMEIQSIDTYSSIFWRETKPTRAPRGVTLPGISSAGRGLATC